MKNFLMFETFISPALLIFLYYIGAIVIPIVSWYFIHWIKTIYFSKKDTQSNEYIAVKMTLRQHIIVYSFFFISFLCMEIFWRILFEFFIAYFDMHDALMKLS